MKASKGSNSSSIPVQKPQGKKSIYACQQWSEHIEVHHHIAKKKMLDISFLFMSSGNAPDEAWGLAAFFADPDPSSSSKIEPVPAAGFGFGFTPPNEKSPFFIPPGQCIGKFQYQHL
jgi:hypothetical protein